MYSQDHRILQSTHKCGNRNCNPQCAQKLTFKQSQMHILYFRALYIDSMEMSPCSILEGRTHHKQYLVNHSTVNDRVPKQGLGMVMSRHSFWKRGECFERRGVSWGLMAKKKEFHWVNRRELLSHWTYLHLTITAGRICFHSRDFSPQLDFSITDMSVMKWTRGNMTVCVVI